MKKVLISAIAAVLFMGGFSVSAQSADPTLNKAKKEICVSDSSKCKEAKTCCRQNRNMDFAFQGIQLTEDQQTRIEQSRQKYLQKNRELRKQMMNMRKNSRDKSMKERQQAKSEYLAEFKEILTHEQYVTYLENIAKSDFPNHKMLRRDFKKKHCDGKAKRQAPKAAQAE